ncbi:MAG: RNA-binding protein, partial [Gammaproteobacteria bacterium]|nr:RNA-binding protein [Gammaproteobacteria bacterium]
RGFAFVEMDSNQAPRAIKELDGKEFLGRNLRVNEGVERNQKAA